MWLFSNISSVPVDRFRIPPILFVKIYDNNLLVFCYFFLLFWYNTLVCFEQRSISRFSAPISRFPWSFGGKSIGWPHFSICEYVCDFIKLSLAKRTFQKFVFSITLYLLASLAFSSLMFFSFFSLFFFSHFELKPSSQYSEKEILRN